MVFRYLARPETAARLSRAEGAWEDAFPAAPRLFLYSRVRSVSLRLQPPWPQLHLPHPWQGDAIIDYRMVERFAERQAARGRHVILRRWDRAPHCEILRFHRTEYAAAVRQLLEPSPAHAAPGTTKLSEDYS